MSLLDSIIPKITTEQDFTEFRRKFKDAFPTDVCKVRLCNGHADPSVECYNLDCIRIYPIYVALGLRFPLDRFIRKFFRHYSLAIPQLSPSSCIILLGFLALKRKSGLDLGFREFRELYIVNQRKHGNNVYDIIPRYPEKILITDVPTSDQGGWNTEVIELRMKSKDRTRAFPRFWGTPSDFSNDQPVVGTFDANMISSALQLKYRSWFLLLDTGRNLFIPSRVSSPRYSPASSSYFSYSYSCSLASRSYTPESPSYSPASPSYFPFAASPRLESPKGGYSLASSSYSPDYPSYSLASRTYTPESPSYSPASPSYTSTSPLYFPFVESPSVESPKGGYSPLSSSYSSNAPSCSLTSGSYTPDSPSYSPASPSYSSNSPSYTPASPLYSPKSPSYSAIAASPRVESPKGESIPSPENHIKRSRSGDEFRNDRHEENDHRKKSRFEERNNERVVLSIHDSDESESRGPIKLPGNQFISYMKEHIPPHLNDAFSRLSDSDLMAEMAHGILSVVSGYSELQWRFDTLLNKLKTFKESDCSTKQELAVTKERLEKTEFQKVFCEMENEKLRRESVDQTRINKDNAFNVALLLQARTEKEKLMLENQKLSIELSAMKWRKKRSKER